MALMGGELPDPGLLGALKCGLPGGTGFKLPKNIGFKKVGVLGAGAGTWSAIPASSSPSLWIPLVGLVVPSVGLLPAGFHSDDGRHPAEE